MTRTRRFLSQQILAGVLLFSSLLLSACGSAHISALRSAQDSFTIVAGAETAEAGDRFERRLEDLDRNELEQALAQNLGWRSAPYYLAEYGKIRDVLSALVDAEGDNLKADRLLGVTLTLEIYARWRMAYYAHLMHLVGQLEVSEEGKSPYLIPLTGIADDAVELAEDADISDQLFPRDLFLLRMLPGMARFDAVLLEVAGVQRDFAGNYNTVEHRDALVVALTKMKMARDSVMSVKPSAQAFADYQTAVLASIESSFNELKLLLPRSMRPSL